MNKLLWLLAAVSMFSCGVSTVALDESVEAEVTESEDDLSASAYTHVIARRDYRKCASPYCGGWFVKDVNKANATEQYVSDVTYVNGSISAAGRDQLRSAGDNELLLLARLGALDKKTNTRKLVVRTAWRGLPGKTVASTDTFYALTRRAPCASSTCPTHDAKQLNGSTTAHRGTLNLSRAAEGQLNRGWLEAQALDEDALVAGRFFFAYKPPAPATSSLDVANVFVKLEASWSCPIFKLAPCPNQGAWTYTYSSSGCIVPDRCVTPGACIALAPQACANGYRTLSFAAAPRSCGAQVCEPEFINVVR